MSLGICGVCGTTTNGEIATRGSYDVHVPHNHRASCGRSCHGGGVTSAQLKGCHGRRGCGDSDCTGGWPSTETDHAA